MGLVKGLSFRDGMTGLVNRITGMGTNRDAATATQFVFQRPSSSTLEALYRANWIARKIVNIPIDDMLREGWHWQADDPLITKLEAEENRLQVKDHLRRALIRDAVYGGAALYLGTDDPDVSQELRLDRMRKGSLRYLTPFHANDLQVVALDRDPERLGQPTMFRMTKHDGSELLIHPSRIIDFCSRPVDRAMSQWNVDDFWGDSRLSCVMTDIAAAGSSMAGASRLMGELAVWVYKINGLSETLAMAGGEDRVQALLNLTNTMKSSINALAVDSEDTAEIITASLAGVPETIRTFLQNVAGAADIPYTRFMGASPDGMNATGASDARNYYDRLAGERENYVVPPMARLDQALIRSALGDWDDNVYRVWDPLWQLSETEQVDLDVKKMEMLGKMQERGLVHDHVIEQVSRVTMIESPNFPGAEEAFEEAEKLPDPRDEQVEEATQVQQPQANSQRQRPQLRVVNDEIVEDAAAWMSQPRHPAGTSQGGQFAPGNGSGGGGSGRSVPLNSLELTLAKSDNRPASARSPSDILKEAGFDDETISKTKQLMRAHAIGGAGQADADAEIARNLHENTKIGEAIRTQAKFELELHKEWASHVETRIDKEIKSLKDDFESGFIDSYYDKFDDWYAESNERTYHEMQRQHAKDPVLYRKGSVDKDVQSWTSNSGGADIGSGIKLVPDRVETMSSLKAKGMEFVGGLVWEMGAQGESEVLMVRKLNRFDDVFLDKFNESAVKRHPKGSSKGGQFAAHTGAGGAGASGSKSGKGGVKHGYAAKYTQAQKAYKQAQDEYTAVFGNKNSTADQKQAVSKKMTEAYYAKKQALKDYYANKGKKDAAPSAVAPEKPKGPTVADYEADLAKTKSEKTVAYKAYKDALAGEKKGIEGSSDVKKLALASYNEKNAKQKALEKNIATLKAGNTVPDVPQVSEKSATKQNVDNKAQAKAAVMKKFPHPKGDEHGSKSLDKVIEKAEGGGVLGPKEKQLYNAYLENGGPKPKSNTPDYSAEAPASDYHVSKKPVMGVKIDESFTAALKSSSVKASAEKVENNSSLISLHKNYLKTLSEAVNANLAIPEASQKTYASIKGSLNPSEKQAIGQYSGSAYKEINGTLRKGKAVSKGSDMAKTINAIDSAMSKMEAKQDFSVLRGVSPGSIKRWSDAGEFKIGATLVDKGYVSTTSSYETASGFKKGSQGYHMVVRVKKGQAIAPIKAMSQHAGENEFLLPRNSAFQIQHIDEKKKIMFVDLL